MLSLSRSVVRRNISLLPSSSFRQIGQTYHRSLPSVSPKFFSTSSNPNNASAAAPAAPADPAASTSFPSPPIDVHNHPMSVEMMNAESSSSVLHFLSSLPKMDPGNLPEFPWLLKWLQYSGEWCADVAMNVFNTMHMSYGLPWWVALVSVACAHRLITMPFTLGSLRNGRKTMLVMDKMQKLYSSFNFQDPSAAVNYKAAMDDLRKTHDISGPFKYVAPMMLQVPIFTGMFIALRKMSLFSDTFPGFAQGGFLWFENLAAADPYMALPIAANALLIANMSLAMVPGQPTNRIMTYVMVPMSLLFTVMMREYPAALFLYYSATNVMSLVPTVLLRSQAFCKWYNSPSYQDMVKHTQLKKPSGLGFDSMFGGGSSQEESGKISAVKPADQLKDGSHLLQGAKVRKLKLQ